MTDWGRSERVEGLVDRTLYEFLYHYWFRVEIEGIENVPDQGGALLVANHAGALPPDGAMIAKAIREEHPHPRPLHLTMEHSFNGFPGLGMVVTKIGGVPAHPANVHRLLFDERALVLVFPEGRKGTEKPVRDRYRLRRFGRGGFVETAMRARAPIVPVAVVGAEEAQPVFARLNLLRRLTRLPYVPRDAAAAAAGEVPDPVPGAGADRGARRRPVGGPGAGADAQPGHPSADPGEPVRDGRGTAERVARVGAPPPAATSRPWTLVAS